MEANLFLPKKVILTQHTLSEVMKQIQQWKIRKVLFIYSKSACNESTLMQIMNQATLLKVAITFFAMPKGEPTLQMTKQTIALMHKEHCEAVIALGGGSAIDLAKATAVLAKDATYSLKTIALHETLSRYPFIAIPTTAGTGSEATKVTVITDERNGVKYNPGHPDLIPDVAILDASWSIDVPKQITAQTGLDALTHAIEAYVSTNSTVLSDMYAQKAIELIHSALPQVYEDGRNLTARQNMLLGSFYAGVAFSNASTNLAHAMGRALGVKWHLPHGLSVALTHPFVAAYSYDSCKKKYDDIATMIGLPSGEHVSGYLSELNDRFFIWNDAQKLSNDDFEQTIEEMTKNALSGNGILTNYQIPTEQQIQSLFMEIKRAVEQNVISNK